MPIISVRDNENNRWIRKAKKPKKTKQNKQTNKQKAENNKRKQKLMWKGENYMILLCI